MRDFAGKLAVITGGGAGMGRELARQLAAEGASIALCDVSKAAAAETKAIIEADKPRQGVRISTHQADVSNETQMLAFRDGVAREHETDHIHILFNNAGIVGGGSMFTDSREQWEKTWRVCWEGVYLGVRSFLPMLVKANEAAIVNTSSVSGFWASIGPETPHTAYSAAKFAVKGFTEALMTDLAVNAPHIKAHLVMPGHIGTSIMVNTRIFQENREGQDMTDAEKAQTRGFMEAAPTSAAEAAKIILDGVKEDRWRILIGRDAQRVDEKVRANPEAAYDRGFLRLGQTFKEVTSN